VLLHAGLFFGLFFNPEDEGDMFLRNVDWFSTDYVAIWGARVSVVGSNTMLQAGRSPVPGWDFTLSNSFSRVIAPGSTQPLTEMSARNFPVGKKRSARRTDNLDAICEPNVCKSWKPQPLKTPRATMVCTAIALHGDIVPTTKNSSVVTLFTEMEFFLYLPQLSNDTRIRII
jgi:hypothetical protein